MSKKKHILGDLALLAFLVINLIVVYLIITDKAYLTFNILMLNITSLILIVSYLTSFTTSIILNVIFLFIYITSIIYMSFSQGKEIHFYIYLWAAAVPAYSISLMSFNSRSMRLEKTNKALIEENKRLVTLDNETGLENIRAFVTQSNVYLKLAKRYQLPLTFMVVKLAYQEDILRIIGQDRANRLNKVLAQGISSAFRSEDYLFIMDKAPFTVAVLLLADEAGAEIVRERVKKAILPDRLKEIAEPYIIEVQFKVAYHQVREHDNLSALDIYDRTLSETIYDV